MVFSKRAFGQQSYATTREPAIFEPGPRSCATTIIMSGRIAAPENVPKPSSVASPNLLSLTHRTRPEPELFFLFLISITCWCGPCGVVGDATASSKRSGKPIGLWGKPGLSSQAGIRPGDGPIDQHR
jgi:hypothetical protein